MLNADDSHNLALVADEVSRLGLTVDEPLRLLREAGQGGVVDIGAHNRDAGAHEGVIAAVTAAPVSPTVKGSFLLVSSCESF